MDKFQIYNKELGEWQDSNILLIPGWNENWVQDKTTDSAKIKLKYTESGEPNWHRGDWCRMLHGANAENTKIYRALENDERIDIAYKMVGRQVTVSICGYAGQNITVYFVYRKNGETHTVSTTINSGDSYGIINLAEDVDTQSIVSVFTEQQPTSYRRAFIVPQNYEEFVIKNITKVEDKINGQWDVQIELAEPIEMLRGVLLETMSFTNQISKEVGNMIYTHEKLSHYSVLKKVLQVTPANNNVYRSWDKKISIFDTQLLKDTAFNDETYSEQSLYGVLLDKYDSSIGRTPVLYFDIDEITNKIITTSSLTKVKYFLKFERQDGFDKNELQLSDLKENCKNYVTNESFENYALGVVSNVDNLTPNIETTFVSENLWAVPEVDSNERDLTQFGTKSDKGIWVIKTPHKIKKVISLKKVIISNYFKLGSDNQTHLKRENIDMTTNVLEEKQYKASGDNQFDTRNVIWFTEGDNKLHLNDFYYQNLNTGGLYPLQTQILNIYQVVYEPLISARIDDQQDYQVAINQNDSQIDSKKFGEYLKNYLASMNKTDIIIQKTVENWSDIAEIGSRVISGEKVYLITNISISNRGYDYDIVYQLNENHFRKSDSIVAPQEIRKNIEIGVESTKERKSMLADTFKISTSVIENENKFNLNKQLLFDSITNYGNTDKVPQLAYLTLKSTLKTQDSAIDWSQDRLCEIGKFITNNMICFNLKYLDNAEAGKQKTLDSLFQNIEIGSPKSQIPILYTDPFGEVKTFNFKLIKTREYDISNIDAYAGWGDYTTALWETQDLVKNTTNYPLITGIASSDLDNPIISINNINYYKDMLDTFNYTFAIKYTSDTNIVLCQAFFKNNTLIGKDRLRASVVKTFAQNMNENDWNEQKDNYLQSTNISTITSGNTGVIIQLANNINSVKCVAIVDSANNPIIIINNFDKIYTSETGQIQLYY